MDISFPITCKCGAQGLSIWEKLPRGRSRLVGVPDGFYIRIDEAGKDRSSAVCEKCGTVCQPSR